MIFISKDFLDFLDLLEFCFTFKPVVVAFPKSKRKKKCIFATKNKETEKKILEKKS